MTSCIRLDSSFDAEPDGNPASSISQTGQQPEARIWLEQAQWPKRKRKSMIAVGSDLNWDQLATSDHINCPFDL